MIGQGAVAIAPLPAPAAETSAVACRNVSVRFVTDRRTVTALENVSFAVERGGFLSLLGPSGCGKSTLLRVVADLIAPSSGQVSVLGASPQEGRENRSLAIHIQHAEPNARLAVNLNTQCLRCRKKNCEGVPISEA